MSKMRAATGVLICLIFGSGCSSRLASAEENENDEQAEDRIVGGDPSYVGEYPWLVSIHKEGAYVCGGSILNPTTILTAAHCFDDTNTDFVTVRAGNFMRGRRDYFEQRVSVEKITQHRKFDEPNWDIAVLELKNSLVFNPYVHSINLPSPWRDDVLTKINRCVVAGYGTINNKGGKPATLRDVDATIASRTYCKRYVEEHYSDYAGYGTFNKRLLCTQDFDKGSCSGDGGSPLVCYDNYDNPYQMGILLWGSIDCYLGFNVYARVSEFISWIDNLD